MKPQQTKGCRWSDRSLAVRALYLRNFQQAHEVRGTRGYDRRYDYPDDWTVESIRRDVLDQVTQRRAA